MIILGIDPALNKLGFAIIEVKGSDNYTLKYLDTLKLKSLNNSEINKINLIINYLKSLTLKFNNISLVCVENQFVNLNVKTSLSLSTVKGAIIGYFTSIDKNTIEVNPKEVKKYITGCGNSDKLQVAKMLRLMINNITEFSSEDESDALAISITGFYKNKSFLK